MVRINFKKLNTVQGFDLGDRIVTIKTGMNEILESDLRELRKNRIFKRMEINGLIEVVA